MKITMLGVGNGFSSGVYDNNAFLEHNGIHALIDCGTTAWTSMDLLGKSRAVVDEIFLTHLHFDHSGGVEAAALYSRYVTGKRIRMVVPAPIADRLWEHVLKGTIENTSENLTCLSDYFDVAAPEEEEEFMFCGMRAFWVRTRHIKGKFSCGLMIGGSLFYTSDMVCDLPLVERMITRGANTIFHDCQLKNAQVHGDFKSICTYPEEVKQRIFLMHHGLAEAAETPDPGSMKFLYQHKEMIIDSASGGR